jgi:cysteine desulfurase / selenocysteine lyase
MALNLVSNTIGKAKIGRGDEVLVTEMEHHSNIVPWQMLCRERRGKLKYIEVEDGKLAWGDGRLERLVSKRTKVFALTHMSNVVGTINDVKKLIQTVKSINPDCVVVVDGAQSVPHMKVDVRELGCDFLTFSGHKAYGPTGVGVLWGRGKILDELEPWVGGGDMIRKVTMKESSYKDAPNKLEAGTSNIGGVIGLGAAIEWLEKKDTKKIREHEVQITKYALEKLQEINCLDIYGPQNAEERGGLVAFNIKGVHSHDTAQILADRNICVRAGHHCAQPLHDKLKIFGSVRASFGVYTSKDDIDRLVDGLGKVIQKFGIK